MKSEAIHEVEVKKALMEVIARGDIPPLLKKANGEYYFLCGCELCVLKVPKDAIPKVELIDFDGKYKYAPEESGSALTRLTKKMDGEKDA